MARIAVLIKQVPKFASITYGENGRLRRDGLGLEMNPYCRRAVSKGVELAAALQGTCTTFTLGPPAAEDSLREAIAWGADRGVLVSDPAFAGSDTLATARALAAALRREGAFDLVLVGLNSVDGETGQVGPEVAELLGLPFAGGVREVRLRGRTVVARCEADSGSTEVEVDLPAVLSCAERLCEPAKVPPAGRAAVSAERLVRLSAADLGSGPWGEEGSPTRVGAVRLVETPRVRRVLEGPVEEQVAAAVALLGTERDDRLWARPAMQSRVPVQRRASGPAVAVAGEPGSPRTVRELLGVAASLAAGLGGRAVLVTPDTSADPRELASWGADELVVLDDAPTEEDVAAALVEWCGRAEPWSVLAPGTVWGRHVAGRLAARLGAGLIGDSLEPELVFPAGQPGRLVAWKPAFGGQMVAQVTTTSPVQIVTVRPGAVPARIPRHGADLRIGHVRYAAPAGRVRKVGEVRDDDAGRLNAAATVVGVGRGVQADELALLEPLRAALSAEWGATRAVTDQGWLPRSRQIGITGHSISPDLYVAVGIHGKFNHTVGVRGAGAVLAINSDRDAPIFDAADVGIVADWREVVPHLVAAFSARRPQPGRASRESRESLSPSPGLVS